MAISRKRVPLELDIPLTKKIAPGTYTVVRASKYYTYKIYATKTGSLSWEVARSLQAKVRIWDVLESGFNSKASAAEWVVEQGARDDEEFNLI